VVFTKYDLFVTTKTKEIASQINPKSFGGDKKKYDDRVKKLANEAATKAIVPLCETPLRSVVPSNRLAWTKVSCAYLNDQYMLSCLDCLFFFSSSEVPRDYRGPDRGHLELNSGSHCGSRSLQQVQGY
jgi:hypothetical protein